MKINISVDGPAWTKFLTVSAQGIYCHDEEPDLIHADSEKSNEYYCMNRNKELLFDAPAILWEQRADADYSHSAYNDFMNTLKKLDEVQDEDNE